MASGTEPQHRASAERSSQSVWEKRGWLELALVGIAVLVFISTLSFGFVYDDRLQILNNPFIQSWRYLAHDFSSQIWAQTTKHPLNFYRPIFLLWLRLDYTVFGPKPWGWHLTSVLLHGAVTLLIFRLALRLLRSRWQAAIAGLVFAVHPVHVESVAWVSGVVDPLMSVFYVGSLLCYLDWRERRSAGWLGASLLLGLLAMLSKEPGVTLPAVVFVHAWMFATPPEAPRRRLREAFWQAAPFALLALGYWGVRMVVLKTASPVVAVYHTICLTLPGLLLFYLRLVVWPVGLSLFYDRQYQYRATFGGFGLPLILLALLGVALALLLRRSTQKREGAFTLAFALLALSPALWVRYFPVDDFVHDRYLYLPLAGFAMLFAVAIREMGGHAAPGEVAPRRQLLPVAAVAVLLTIGTVLLEPTWYDDLLLWYHCYKTAPHNEWVLNNLGSSLGERGEYRSAVPFFLEAIQQDPGNSEAQANLGYTYYQMGELQPAEKYLKGSVALDATDWHSLLYLGIIHFKQGALGEAESDLSRCLAVKPEAKGAHLALALVLEQRGDVQGAIREAQAELEHYPAEPQARQELDRLRHRK